MRVRMKMSFTTVLETDTGFEKGRRPRGYAAEILAYVVAMTILNSVDMYQCHKSREGRGTRTEVSSTLGFPLSLPFPGPGVFSKSTLRSAHGRDTVPSIDAWPWRELSPVPKALVNVKEGNNTPQPR